MKQAVLAYADHYNSECKSLYLRDLELVTLLQVLCEDFDELLRGDITDGDSALLVDHSHFDLVSVFPS